MAVLVAWLARTVTKLCMSYGTSQAIGMAVTEHEHAATDSAIAGHVNLHVMTS